MKIADLLDRPIAYHRIFVALTGSVKAAILLSQAVYWQKRATQADGWWYKTAEEWQDETGLTRHEQDTARAACSKYLKTDLRGVPATLYWHVEEVALSADLIDANSQSSLTKSGKLDSRKQSNINKNTENTSETTTDNSAADAAGGNQPKPPKPPKANQVPELLLFREITGRYPAKGSWDTVLTATQLIRKRLGREPLKDDLAPFYAEWCNRAYNAAAVFWLSDWAAKGEIPTNGHKPGKQSLQQAQSELREWLSERQMAHGN